MKDQQLNEHDQISVALADFRALLLDALPADAAYVKVKAAREWFEKWTAAGGFEIAENGSGSVKAADSTERGRGQALYDVFVLRKASPEELDIGLQYLLSQIGCEMNVDEMRKLLSESDFD